MAQTPTAVPGVDRFADKAKLDLDRDATPSDAGATDVEAGGTARPDEGERSASNEAPRPSQSGGTPRATDDAEDSSRIDGAGRASKPSGKQ